MSKGRGYLGKVFVSIKTVDRRIRTPGCKNYLLDTIENFAQVGGFSDDRMGGVLIADSGSGIDYLTYIADHVVQICETRLLDKSEINCTRRPHKLTFSMTLPWITLEHPEGPARSLHENASFAIRRGAELAESRGCDWLLILEDDLDFCADFIGSALRWASDHEDDQIPFYALGANYNNILQVFRLGGTAWRYRANNFYGAQALLMRTGRAKRLAEWLGPSPNRNGVETNGHDLLLQDWINEDGPGYILASAPSLVQHIGTESGIGNRSFQFTSWQGRDWSYA